MSRHTRLNTLLTLAVAMLAALLWFFRSPPPAAPAPLLTVARSAISQITIQPTGSPAIVMQRQRGQWHLRQPITARANTTRIHALLALASIAPARRYAPDAIAAEQTGLDQPVATIQFNDAPALAIGKPVPTTRGANKRYVQIGNTVAAATIAHAGLLDIPWPQWVDPQLLAADAELERLQLPQFTLTRAPTGGWRVSPVSHDQGADAAQATVNAWRHVTTLAVQPARDKPAQANITLVFADGHERRLDVVARQPQLVLRDAQLGIAYHLAGDLGPRLFSLTPRDTASTGDSHNMRQRPARNRDSADQRSRQDN